MYYVKKILEINSLLNDYDKICCLPVKDYNEKLDEVVDLEKWILIKIDLMLLCAHSPEIRAQTFYEKFCDNHHHYRLTKLFDKTFENEELKKELPIFYMPSSSFYTDKNTNDKDIIISVKYIDSQRTPVTIVRNINHVHYHTSKSKENFISRSKERCLMGFD